MNGILIGWGVDPKIANTFDEMIIAAFLVILAIGLDYLCQAIFVGSMKKLAQHTHYQWDSLLLKRKVVHHLVHTIPASWSMPCCLWRLYGGKVCCFYPRKYVPCISCSLCCWR